MKTTAQTRKLTIDGVTFQVAPTPVVKLAAAMPFLSKAKIQTPEGQQAVLEAVFWGARRAGAEITLEWLVMNVDVHSMPQVFDIFATLNKVERSKADLGEAARPDPPAQ